jgi:hypothetical protein
MTCLGLSHPAALWEVLLLYDWIRSSRCRARIGDCRSGSKPCRAAAQVPESPSIRTAIRRSACESAGRWSASLHPNLTRGQYSIISAATVSCANRRCFEVNIGPSDRRSIPLTFPVGKLARSPSLGSSSSPNRAVPVAMGGKRTGCFGRIRRAAAHQRRQQGSA